jgi:hypothetical protein
MHSGASRVKHLGERLPFAAPVPGLQSSSVNLCLSEICTVLVTWQAMKLMRMHLRCCWHPLPRAASFLILSTRYHFPRLLQYALEILINCERDRLPRRDTHDSGCDALVEALNALLFPHVTARKVSSFSLCDITSNYLPRPTIL